MARFALCIGINDYPGTNMDLRGCVNDANDWAEELVAREFEVLRLLNEQATKSNMVAAMRNAIARGRPGDTVAITFSGHGTYVFDTDREEEDRFDEALCPFDIQETGDPLIDDEIHKMFSSRTPGLRLLLVADSCHSGTVSRDTSGPRKRFLSPRLWKRDPSPVMRRASDAAIATRSAFLAPVQEGEHPIEDDVLLSGCMEGKENFSYDGVFDGRSNGAFTRVALDTLRQLPKGATYEQWIGAITPAKLPTKDYAQIPQLFATLSARRREALT